MERTYGKDAEAQSVVPSHCVRVNGHAARVKIPPQAGHDEPRVDLVRQGAVVQAIDVTCSCGRHIRLSCVYS